MTEDPAGEHPQDIPAPRLAPEPPEPAEASQTVEPDGPEAIAERVEPEPEAVVGDAHDAEPEAEAEPLPEPENRPPLVALVEAVLMVAEKPVGVAELATGLAAHALDVERVLAELAAQYRADGRGFDLRHVGGGWRFYTAEECAPWVERFVLAGQMSKLSQAALETLAVVAYQQPVSRGRISAVRGVSADGVIRTLTARGLVEEATTDPETGAILYRTTDYFLERLGLRGLDELPPLAPLLPGFDDIEDLIAP
ncbi:SMC-Scp complex subunit ScpB [Frankia inefficax]|uniref:Chromosome segregation and condensation protein, ScpB n=1 Tax=Pseudofrankia inefficax (strain DSM 45817 / CECT 9037 / DDB 130130 / EuI1c) TaxID=298654 RepID=E3JAA3_PSEI1|nr:chromosome segregation and condensation protein, ScpB [Pseudofrankia inefficax]